MQPSNLENRMVVELANGNRYLVVDDRLFNSNGKTFMLLSNYDENLRDVYNDPLYDITTVYHKVCTFDEVKTVSAILWQRESFTYPMWFKTKTFDDNDIIVKFTSLTEGTVVKSTSVHVRTGYPFKSIIIPHTDTNVWTQVPEPVEELTLEQVCQELGRNIKIIN